MITALTFFDPELAERALLDFCSSYEFFEHLICEVRILSALKLLTAHAMMKVISASQAIPLRARRAREIVTILPLLIDESILAVGTGAP